jgi:hypothetical protein
MIAMKRRYAFLVWLVGTLIAIAVIGENRYLGAGLAIGFGIAFGLVSYRAFLDAGDEDKRTTSDKRRGTQS